jgi:arginine decarboxylase-like protein
MKRSRKCKRNIKKKHNANFSLFIPPFHLSSQAVAELQRSKEAVAEAAKYFAEAGDTAGKMGLLI